MLPKQNIMLGVLSRVSFIVIFLILSSFIIMLANGYTYNWANYSFQHTAIISLNTKPEKVTASINGKKKTFTHSPIKFAYLAPGNYYIEAQKPGYASWSKTVAVRSGEAVSFPYVILFLNSTEAHQASIQAADLLVSRVPDTTDLDVRGNEIWVRPLNRTYPIPIADNTFLLVSRFSVPIKKAIWLPNKTHILFQLDREIHIIDRDGSNDIVLAKLENDQPSDFLTTSDGKNLIYGDGTHILQKKIQ